METDVNEAHETPLANRKYTVSETTRLGQDREDELVLSVYDVCGKWQKHWILFIICSTVFLSGVDEDAYLPLIPVMVRDFQTTETFALLTISVYLFTMSLSSLLWGTLCDYYGRKMISVFGIGASACSSIACYLSPNIIVFLVCRAAEGCFVTVALVTGHAIIADIYSSNDRAGVYGIYYGIYLSSALFGPTIGGFVSRMYHWKMLFMLISMVSFLLLIAYIFIVPETQHYKVRCHLQRQGKYQLLEAQQISPPTLTNPFLLLFDLTDRLIIPYVLLHVVSFASFSCSYLLFSSELARLPYSYPEHVIGMLFLLGGAISLFGSVLGGKISDLFFKRLSQNRQIPEGYLIPSLSFSILISFGLLVYGWSFQANLPGPIPVLAQISGAFSYFASRPGMLSFFTSKYEDRAGSIAAILTFLQIFFTSVIFTFFAQLVQIMHEGVVFTVLSLGNLTAAILACATMIKKMRGNRNSETYSVL